MGVGSLVMSSSLEVSCSAAKAMRARELEWLTGIRRPLISGTLRLRRRWHCSSTSTDLRVLPELLFLPTERVRLFLLFLIYCDPDSLPLQPTASHRIASHAHAPPTAAAPEQLAAVAMRSIFYSLLSLATIASTLAAPDNAARTLVKRADADDWEDKVPDTIFNGQTVPPMPVLDLQSLTRTISKGNWYVTACVVDEHLLTAAQAGRVLLALVSPLQGLCAYAPNRLRILLHIQAHRGKERARGRLSQFLQAFLRFQLCQGRLHSLCRPLRRQ